MIKFYDLRKKVDSKIIRTVIIVSAFCAPFMDKAVAYAAPTPTPGPDTTFDFLKENTGTDNGAFTKLADTAKETGFSFYKLLMVVGIIGLVCSVIALGLNHAFTKNTTKKSENKSHIVDICLGAILIFGAMSLIGLIKTVADKL